ncbi:MAG: type IV pilus modification protein PilV [Burkholderiales bacterium]|nr:type IV pilus modification protein PilV [Burkholderiales bacterium]
MVRPERARAQRGTTLVEVLVTIIIISFGLLGMAGLQVRLQVSEMESYQRSQALLLLNDMATRITANRNNAASYVTSTALGSSMTCPTATATIVERDKKEWCDALQGASETSGSSKLGAMIGGRGCVQSTGSEYMITVSWQGLTPIAAPPSSVTCGANQYDTTGTPCVNDLCRRSITTMVRIANLT